MKPVSDPQSSSQRNAENVGRMAAWAGIAFAVLFLVGLRLFAEVPPSDASDAEIEDFYGGDGRRVLIAAAFYVIPFAGIAFLWFLAALRSRVVHFSGVEDPLLSTVQLLSGVLFVAMMFGAAAGHGATAAAIEFAGESIPSVGETRDLLALSETFTGVFAVRSAAVFVAAGTTQARHAAVFPRWLTTLGYIVALVLLFTPTYYWPVVVSFPAWVAVASLVMLRRAPRSEPLPPG